jgi:hypothetical protein
MDSTVLVNSETKLFTIRYDSNIWKNPSTAEIEALAYINRNEAWKVFEPRLRSRSGPFMAAWDTAENTGDPIKAWYACLGAAKLLENDNADIPAMLDFGDTLNPSKMSVFKPLREALANLSDEAAKDKGKIALFIKLSDDSQNQIANAIGKAFSDQGFKLVNDEALSSNGVVAKVNPNKEVLEAGTFYTPSIEITIYGGGGAIFTWNGSVTERRGAFKADIAKRRAYGDLAKVIHNGLWDAFDTEMRR